MLILIDVKENISDTTSESSSLDLDFFAPSISQPQEGKTGTETYFEIILEGCLQLFLRMERKKIINQNLEKKFRTRNKMLFFRLLEISFLLFVQGLFLHLIS